MKRLAILVLCLVMFFNLFTMDGRASGFDYVRFSSLREYELTVSRLSLPADFVSATQLHMLGTLTYGSFSNNEYLSCHYGFSSGVSVEIDHDLDIPYYDSRFGPDYLTEIPEGTETMLYMPNPGGSYVNKIYYTYFRNGLYYTYSQGYLQSILWIADNICFELGILNYGSHQLSQYTHYPILSQLLSLSEEESNAAIAEICQSIGVRLQKTHFQIRSNRDQWIVHALFIILLSAFLIIRWIIAKRRRARGIVTRRQQRTTRDAIGELPLSAFTNHESPFDTPNTH